MSQLRNIYTFFLYLPSACAPTAIPFIEQLLSGNNWNSADWNMPSVSTKFTFPHYIWPVRVVPDVYDAVAMAERQLFL